MRNYWYPTGKSCWGEEEPAAMRRVMESGRYTMGEEVEAFESEFAAYHGMKHAIMVNSGSSANLVAVAALFHKQDNPLRPGDIAYVPALAWATTYAPLIQYGLRPVLMDCDETWTAKWNLTGAEGGWVEVPLLPAAGAVVIGCSVLGNPASFMWALFGSTNERIYHLDDNSESVGASFKEERCGTIGLMNTFSFFYSHQLSAIEGGIILTNDDECAALCRLLRNHGWSKHYDGTFNDEYRFDLMGYNLRPLEMHAAIAREQLKKLDWMRTLRMGNFNIFQNTCADMPVTFQAMQGRPNPFGVAFEVETPERRDVLVKALRSAGIDCRPPVGGSFRKQPYGLAWADQQTPNADRIHERGVFLGCFASEMSREIEEAAKIMRQVL